MRDDHAGLLAGLQSDEPPDGLAQAIRRAEFLLQVSRTLSAVQNPLRALESLSALLLDDLVDVAEVVVHSGPWLLYGGGVQGQESVSGTGRWGEATPDGLGNVLDTGIPEEVVLPRAGSARRARLEEFLVDDSVVAAADERGTEQLLVLPLHARGHSFGLLVLGRGSGFGFADSRTFLEDLAERVAIGIDAGLVVAESRHVASVLRRSLAPVDLPEVPGLELASFYRVAHQSQEVGGDFFDVHGPDDDLTVVCGDVTGKGVEAAVEAKRIRNAVRTASHVDRSPGWVLGLVNEVLVSEAGGAPERIATATCLRLRAGDDSLRIDLANAGHPSALLLRADGSTEELNAPGIALALLPDSTYEETAVELGPRDTLLLYTDGVTEARGADDLFGDHRLRTVMGRLAGVPAAGIVESVALAVSEHVNERNHDDIAVVAVQFRPDQR